VDNELPFKRESCSTEPGKASISGYYVGRKDGVFHVFKDGESTGLTAKRLQEAEELKAKLESSNDSGLDPQILSGKNESNDSVGDEVIHEIAQIPPLQERKFIEDQPSRKPNSVRKANSQPLRSEHDEEMDRAVRLFQFLRELTLLRTETIRSLDQYSKVLWFHDVPDEPGCVSIFRLDEELRSDALLEIEQPRFGALPMPSDSLIPWIDYEQLKDSTLQEPVVRESRTIESGEGLQEGQSGVRYDRWLDHPELHSGWQTFVENDWSPWATESRRKQSVQAVYEQVHEIYENLQKLGEKYELLLAVGLLTWTPPSKQSVCRHLLTAKANISFDTVSGIIRITAPPEGIKFQLEQDMLELSERPANHHRKSLEELVDILNEEPLLLEATGNLLTSWLNAISARGIFIDGMKPDLKPQSDPQVTLAPALIFRERTERNLVRLFEEIIESIEQSKELPLGVQRLISIIDDSHFDAEQGTVHLSDEEIYFPLPANAEQREIAQKLKSRQGVLVQGPPGTGKSHTIANLVCHLLATGRRILITSHTPRALTVLRDKFPDEMKDLCVSVIGDDSSEARRALEESVAGITSKQRIFNHKANEQLIGELRTRLDELRQGEAWTFNALRNIREKDTYSHPAMFGTYSGTAQRIAQRVAVEQDSHSWLDFNPHPDSDAGLANEEATELLALTRVLTPEKLSELRKFTLDPDELTTPEHFIRLMSQLAELSQRSAQVSELKGHPAFAASAKLENERREELVAVVSELCNRLQRIQNRRETWVPKATAEILSDRDRTWRNLLTISKQHLSEIGDDYLSLTAATVTGIDDKDAHIVRAQATQLLQHLDSGGNLGFGPFRAKPVREASYLLKEVRVNGVLCNNAESIRTLLRVLKVTTSLNALRPLWSEVSSFSGGHPVAQISELYDWCEPLEEAVELHSNVVTAREKIQSITGMVEPQWDQFEELFKFAEVLLAGDVERQLDANRAEVADLQMKLKIAAAHPNAHAVMQQLLDAVDMQDSELFNSGYQSLLTLGRMRTKLQRREELVTKLSDDGAPLIAAIEANRDDVIWDSRLKKFVDAWNWARVAKWLEDTADPKNEIRLSAELENCQSEIRTTIAKLAAAKAWSHTFQRLSLEEHQSLIAWSYAMRRIGKGKGKYAEKHRRDARKHMESCRSAIPAWIMPIHKVVETTKIGAEPYDVVIVDEASQSGPEALFLTYIAKQIVVVGDDKQISPEFVGQNRADVDALRTQFLKDIPFSDAIGVDHSFFDQAKIRYRGTIRLKEHFRCMPEIIQFSNNLCYADEPLIPLRQFGAGRLAPVVETRYIKTGYCDDESRKTVNMPEAEAVIEQIRLCCANPAYAGKTIGVISLLNTSGQAEYIERRFKTGEILDKDEMKERKFRVGDPYVFQGDERDIIFISMVSSPRTDGKKVWPLTMEKYERSFNVAVSRARDQLWLFHSVSLADLNPKCLRFRLLEYCSNPYVETAPVGDIDLPALRNRLDAAYAGVGSPPSPFDSWFEVDVFLRIVARGYRVIPQYPMNGYRIDLIVEGLKGRLAVECDGDQWHGPEQYERDTARQRDLERCGMQFWRVRGSAFYFNPDKTMESLWQLLEQMEIFPSVIPPQAIESNT
jgi:very-short-patch-repair endonuclease